MKTLKTEIALASILSLMLLISLAAAKDELPKPNILPDHPLYPVKTFFERVRLWLTFDPEAKARFHAYLAEQRLAEMNEMVVRGKYQYIYRLREEYEKELEETENEANKTFGLGKNATALLEHVCNVTYKHILVLERVLSKAPEAAREGLERAINASIKGHMKCLERVEKLLNKTNESLGKRLCVSDEECEALKEWCPLVFGFKTSCLMIPNRTTGICRCIPAWNRTWSNCTDDSECRNLPCPRILGNDTSVCLNGRCICGAKWQLRNRTEWRERFEWEFSNTTFRIQERIRERFEAEIRKKG